MTNREKAIVMAYTGICMLSGDKFKIYHQYVEKIMGRAVYTHELGIEHVAEEIREKSKADFVSLCKDEWSGPDCYVGLDKNELVTLLRHNFGVSRRCAKKMVIEIYKLRNSYFTESEDKEC